MPKRNRRVFSAEQKADAVRLIREVGSLAQVARDLDIGEGSLRRWVSQAEVDEAMALASSFSLGGTSTGRGIGSTSSEVVCLSRTQAVRRRAAADANVGRRCAPYIAR